MSTRVITPPNMDINRDIPDSSPNPSVVAIPTESGETGGASLPESAGVPPITTSSLLGCPSPAISPNSSGNMMMGPTTELILSTRIRSVSRCLFGPPDPHTSEFAREKVKEIRDQDKRRYNFDFDAEEPLDGPFKWEAVPVAPPHTTVSSTTTSSMRSSCAPRAYALSRFPYLSGSTVDRGMISPPLSSRSSSKSNHLPSRQLYYEPDRESLLIARTIEDDRFQYHSSSATATSASINRPITSTRTSTFSPVTSTIQSSTATSQTLLPTVVDPTMLLPSPEASSCSSEDSANVHDMEMELGEDEEEVTSVGSSSTEDELKLGTESNVLESAKFIKSDVDHDTATSTAPIATSAKIIHHHSSSTSSGLSSRVCSSSSRSSTSSTTSSRRTKSVSSSSSSPSASPSSPSSSQPLITRFLPQRKRPASTSTTKDPSNDKPESTVGEPEKKRAAF